MNHESYHSNNQESENNEFVDTLSSLPSFEDRAASDVSVDKNESIVDDKNFVPNPPEGYRTVGVGERSAAYRRKEDGDMIFESQYIDMVSDFRENYNIEPITPLSLALGKLSVDLCHVDASNGKVLETKKGKAGFSSRIEAYDELLQMAEKDPDDAKVISEFFDSMDGKALDMIKNEHAEYVEKRDNASEKDKFDEEVKEMRSKLYEYGLYMKSDYREISKDIDELEEADFDEDVDGWEHKIIVLKQKVEALESILYQYNEKNEEWYTFAESGLDFADDREEAHIENLYRYIANKSRRESARKVLEKFYDETLPMCDYKLRIATLKKQESDLWDSF